MTEKISVLILQDRHGGVGLEFRTIEATLPAFTRAVECEYLEAITGTDWGLFCDEELKGSINKQAIRLVGGLATAYRLPELRGRCLVFGRQGSHESDVPEYVVDMALLQIPPQPDDVRTVCLYRFGNKVYVYDDQATAIKGLLEVIARHREVHHETPIEAYFGISANKWVEIRVDIMDDYKIDLTDRRNDKSYG